MNPTTKNRYIVPLSLVICLFFVWAISANLLPTMIRQLMKTCELTPFEASFTETAYWLAYFICPIPIAMFMKRYTYKAGIIFGLLMAAAGALLFFPAAVIKEYWFYLCVFFVIATGMCFLETAANPYVTVLGAPESAHRRLNLAQSFNGLGCILAPVIVGGFLFSDKGNSVALPYSIMGVAVLAVALLFTRMKLPEISQAPAAGEDEAPMTIRETIKWLWSRRRFRIGVMALFCYEIAEISINSLFINYATSDGWMDKTTASLVLSFGALGLFMLARVTGSWVMSRIRAEKVLLFCAVMTVLGALAVTADIGAVSKAGVFVCYAFEAIMFPTIFAITIVGVGRASKIASSFLMMTPLGGAVGTLLMGLVADSTSMSTAFIVPAAGYAFVLLYAIAAAAKKFDK